MLPVTVICLNLVEFHVLIYIFVVIKNEHLDHIPSSLIFKWWSKQAKIEFVCLDTLDEIDCGAMKDVQFGAVSVVAHNLWVIAT